jgi:hypothetical protein
MSWNSTVTCSYCWNSGHNKAGCPDRKADYERRKKTDPDSYFVHQYEDEKSRRSKRSCGYCKESGHTKPTCQYIKADKRKTVEMNKTWREATLNHFKNIGLGVGALVQFVQKSSWQDDRVDNVLISEVIWNNLTFAIKNGACPYSFRVRTLENFSETRMVDFPVDPAGVITQNSEYGTHVRILGPVSSSAIEANVPPYWLSGEGKEIDDMFLDYDGKPRQRYNIDWIKE